MNTPNNKYDSLILALEDLTLRQYAKSFILKQDGLYCVETKDILKPSDVVIVEFHRFEGASDFEDMSIIYVLESTNGLKGTIIDAFGTYADSKLGEFLRDVQFKRP
jgi:hypothetical protein